MAYIRSSSSSKHVGEENVFEKLIIAVAYNSLRIRCLLSVTVTDINDIIVVVSVIAIFETETKIMITDDDDDDDDGDNVT